MKLGKIASRIIGSVAPLLATALPGPFSGLAMSALKGIFGTDDESEIEKQLASGNPDALVKLKAAEQELKAKMRELDIAEEDLYLKDRQDARALAKATSIWPQLALTAVAISAFGTVLYVLVLQSQIIPPANKDLVIFLVGQLSIFTGMGFSFFLGSSKGSKEKTVLAAQQGQ
jgi:hypothetical protein